MFFNSEVNFHGTKFNIKFCMVPDDALKKLPNVDAILNINLENVNVKDNVEQNLVACSIFNSD